jgi:MFS family permease
MDSMHQGLQRLTADFGRFWAGQTISSFGSAFTSFALPLLVYQLTHSALGLASASVASFLPWPLFGLLIGAWVDRVDRKRLMIITDVLRAAALASIPVLAASKMLSVWWIYVVAFLTATLSVGFTLAQVAAVPSLVGRDDLVAANGRIQASYAAAAIAGPAVAGILATWLTVPALLYFDALSFLISAGSLAFIGRSFNAPQSKLKAHIRQDIADGLRYVLRQPVVRTIVALAAVVNFLIPTIRAQLVLFADQQHHANAIQLSWCYAAGPMGALGFSLVAGRVSRRFAFGRIVLGSCMLYGLAVLLVAVTPWFWMALLSLALSAGLLTLFNITQGSLRQRVVPHELFGRVGSAVNVIAQSSAPLGIVVGGVVITATNKVAVVYGGIGAVMILVTVGFTFSPLARAEQYLSVGDTSPTGGA